VTTPRIPLTVTLVLGTCPPERRTVARQIAGRSAALVTIERQDDAESVHPDIDDAIDAVARHPLAPRHLVLDCGSTVRPVDAVSAVLGHRDTAVLDAVVTVVDAAHLLHDLQDDEYVTHDEDGDTAYTARSMITVEQLEYADHSLIATKDREGRWWSTFFGNDEQSHFREKPGLIRVDFDAEGRIVVAADQPFARPLPPLEPLT
jgi:hypothetical protein